MEQVSEIDNKVPTNRYNKRFSSLIRDIKIFLPVYDKKEDEDDLNFVGRERVMERLFQWLSKPGKGSYLITGFRGMGKTTIVRKVTERVTKKTHLVNNLIRSVFVLSVFAIFLLGYIYGLEGCKTVFEKVKNCDFCYNKLFVIILIAFLVCLLLPFIITPILKLLCKNSIRCPDGFVSKCALLIHIQSIRDKIGSRWDKVVLLWNEMTKMPSFNKAFVKRINRGRKPDNSEQKFNRIKIEVNLGHEVLHERDILSLIATNIRHEYGRFVKSLQPCSHFIYSIIFVIVLGFVSYNTCILINNTAKKNYAHAVTKGAASVHQTAEMKIANSDSSVEKTDNSIALENDSWLNRFLYNTYVFGSSVSKEKQKLCRAFLFIAVSLCIFLLLRGILALIPWVSTPRKMLKRLQKLNERIVSVTNIENGSHPSIDNKILSVSLFNHHRRRTIPLADVREIETELAEIINIIGNRKQCLCGFDANFIIVFDEMDKIDPAMMEQHKTNEMPEFTDAVKGFPDGMDSRERRRNVLKLLANIKLFINNSNAKFIFISGRELYDAYLADLSDRDFAISSIFTGVLNADSFLTPEGGQTDVRSMSEWYIANRLIPYEWQQRIAPRQRQPCAQKGETLLEMVL